MPLHPLAGKPAPREILVNVPRLITAYFLEHPDGEHPDQRVSLRDFRAPRFILQEKLQRTDHILAVTQAICDYRKANGINGPLFLGMDTHALSEPSQATALEVLAANAVPVRMAEGHGYTPTPVISHAILVYNRGRSEGLSRRDRDHALSQPA